MSSEHPEAASPWFAGGRRSLDPVGRLRRAGRVFLARLLVVYGREAPGVLRRMADELEGLAVEGADERVVRQMRRRLDA